MTEKLPIITVTCTRDLPMLDLQAQGINLYLDKSCPVWIIVNEKDPTLWFDFFNKNIRDYYKNHDLTVLTINDFEGEWNKWIPHSVNPWSIGWETQQILKLLISSKITDKQYLVLDSQNFLIKEWGPSLYSFDKVPARPGHFVMPMNIWEQYSNKLGISVESPTSNTLSMCTPIFFDTSVVSSLIEFTGGYKDFSMWFKNASSIKSEFILYALWLEKLGGLEKFHRMYTVPEDWGNPMLRDCNSSEDFEHFISHIGTHKTHAWVSSNHRAWGNMDASQYRRLLNKLATYNLFPKFDEYRSNYVDLKF